MRRTAIHAGLLTAFIACSEIAARAQGCSGCRAALEFSEEGRQLVASLEGGVLLLMAAPYVMIGAIAFAVVRAYRKNRVPSENPEVSQPAPE